MRVRWPGRDFFRRILGVEGTEALDNLYNRTGGPVDRFDLMEQGQDRTGPLSAAIAEINGRLAGIEGAVTLGGSILADIARLRQEIAALQGLVVSTVGATAATGSVLSGPTASNDNSVLRYDGVTGQKIQGSPVSIDDSGNVSGVAGVTASGSVGAVNVDASGEYRVDGTKVVSNRVTGWTAATGTPARTTFATYTAPTISASPTQAEVQAIATATQTVSRRLKALLDDLFFHGLIGT